MITWRRRWLSLWHVDRSVWTYTSRIQRNKHESWFSGSGMTPWVLRMEDRNVDGNVAFSTAHFFTFTFFTDFMHIIGVPIWSSVKFSCSVVINSLRCHEPQHTRVSCPSPTPGDVWRNRKAVIFLRINRRKLTNLTGPANLTSSS